MLPYTFRGGAARRDAYTRFTKWTPSAGFEIKGAWVSASNAGGFLLLDVSGPAALLDFSARFKDLNDDVVITPVVELAEGLAIAQTAYAWVDSVG